MSVRIAGTELVARKALLEEAREELFSHLLRSAVATWPPGERQRWLRETLGYLVKRYPDLDAASVDRLYLSAERLLARRSA